MRETFLRTIIELHEASAVHAKRNPTLAQLLTKAADQLEKARREASPDEPVVIIGHVEEDVRYRKWEKNGIVGTEAIRDDEDD